MTLSSSPSLDNFAHRIRKLDGRRLAHSGEVLHFALQPREVFVDIDD
jgi:hypothetical protein